MTINDNLGYLVAGLFRAISSGTSQTGVSKDITGATEQWRVYFTNVQSDRFMNTGATDTTQIGKGSAPSTRQDINIEVPFTNGGVEDNPVASSGFGYISALGKITIPTLIAPTFGAGAISEVCHFFTARGSPSGAVKVFLIFRDIIPVVNFISGQSVNVEHEVLV